MIFIIKNEGGNNAYSIACFYGCLNSIKYLESKGNFIDSKSKIHNNSDPYLCAIFVNTNKSSRILKYYDTKQYKFTKINDKGENSLRISIKQTNRYARIYLLDAKYKKIIVKNLIHF